MIFWRVWPQTLYCWEGLAADPPPAEYDSAGAPSRRRPRSRPSPPQSGGDPVSSDFGVGTRLQTTTDLRPVVRSPARNHVLGFVGLNCWGPAAPRWGGRKAAGLRTQSRLPTTRIEEPTRRQTPSERKQFTANTARRKQGGVGAPAQREAALGGGPRGYVV